LSQSVFKIPSCDSKACRHGDETFAPLANGIVNNALFHSSSHISHMLYHIINIMHFVWQTCCRNMS